MSASKAQRAETAKRRSRALAMRLAGADYETIAIALKYSGRAAACKDISRALDEHRREAAAAAEELRHTEVMRLDRLQAGVWAQAIGGDVKSVEAALRVIAQRVKLLGLEAQSREGQALSAVDAWLSHMLPVATAPTLPVATGTPADDDEDDDDDGAGALVA